jgi:membrane associated rhomboid family serine protease
MDPLHPVTKALYLDPTTGSIAFQAAIGGLLAATAALRLYWRRVSELFHGARRRQNDR